MTEASGGKALRQLAEAMRLQQAGRLEDAEALYAAIIGKYPDDATALINGGVLALTRGDVAKAIARLTVAVRVAPRNAIAHNNLGFAQLQARDPDAALAALDEAVRLSPAYAQAHNNIGIALVQLQRPDEAAVAFERALMLDPRAADTAINLGEVHARAGRAEPARRAFERALAVDPGSVTARTCLAFARALGRDVDGARAELEAIVAEHPESQAAQRTLGAVANWSWAHERGEAAFRAALALQPDDAESAFGVASTLLARGRYREGFAVFEQRAEGIGSARTRFARWPSWTGARVAGTLLVYAEQGLGDVVQFARFVARARERASRVVLLVDDYWTPLEPLLAGMEGADRVVTSVGALSNETIAARASILSLPHLLGVAVDALDAAPYLHAPPDRAAAWRERLRDVPHSRVGLAWSVFARSDYGYVTQHKSVPPAVLAPLLDVPGMRFVTLQPGAAGDPAVFGDRGARIVDLRSEIRDFGDTAALIESLDLVIAPDTAVTHVAGALGVPVWMLDRFNCCWRWRLATHESPWYPSLRIFRQASFGDWSQPVAHAFDALRALQARRTD
ncbi:MAG TPA: tetratricopeptide repeat protein [Casimicrobiaceae bacterium]|nr:tetratricopeptide repeat protein [Casimicrobiaceae bacterium]